MKFLDELLLRNIVLAVELYDKLETVTILTKETPL